MLAERLVMLRTQRKKTQQDMSDLLGITRPAYTAYESGSRKPDYDTLQKLADYFEVSVDFLLGRSNGESTQSLKDTPPAITRIARAGKKMTEEEAENLEKIAKALYPRLFDEKNT